MRALKYFFVGILLFCGGIFAAPYLGLLHAETTPQRASLATSTLAVVKPVVAAAAPTPVAAKPAAPALPDFPPVTAEDAKDAKQRKITDAFFSGPILKLSIELAPDQVERLKRDERNYVEATIKEGGKLYKGVAIKLKGSAGSFQGFDGKPGMTLSFAKFKGADRFYGMKRFHLNNAAQDATYLNELIAGEMARAAGVPASRCTHAFVELNGRDLGLYVLKEGFTKDFLAGFFKDPSGDLYDGGFVKDIEESTEKDEGDPKDKRDLKELIEASREGDHTKRWERLGALLDIDQFITYMAMEAIVVHWDGYSFNRNNYRFYKNPETGKFVFFLHGMDQAFNDPNMSIQRDFGAMVSNAVMRAPQAKAMYLARVESLYEKVIKPIDWPARVDEAGRKVRDALAAKDPNRGKDYENQIKTARSRVEQRIASVAKQLGEIPKPVVFGQDGVMKLAKDWRKEGNASQMEEAQRDGQAVLQIRADHPTTASWRKTVQLPAGKYRLEAKVRAAGIAGEGAGLRVSGGDRAKMEMVTGDSDWKTIKFPIETPGGDVVLVAELRASKGEVLFQNDSLQLVQEK